MALGCKLRLSPSRGRLGAPSFRLQAKHAQRTRTKMSGSTYGTLFRVTTFGESHGKGVGCVVDGVPPRLPIEEEEIQFELDR